MCLTEQAVVTLPMPQLPMVPEKDMFAGALENAAVPKVVLQLKFSPTGVALAELTKYLP